MPGAYCAVEMKIPRKTRSLLVPAEAIIFNQRGLQVALANNGVASFRQIRIARDLGATVDVYDGLAAGDLVILNPPVSLHEGIGLFG